MVAILGYSREQIFEAVTDMYTAVAETPASPFHFPVGKPACRALGYLPEQTDHLPQAVLESFAGVGHPFRADVIRPGDTVLDVGAGAGTDSLIAASLVGPEGEVIALDLTPAMTRKLERTTADAGTDNLCVLCASAEDIPLPDESVDVITSNGALNLVPDKRRAVAEMFRVLRPGGRLQIADVVIHRPVTVDCHTDPRLWVECVVGATIEEQFLDLFRQAGFEEIELLRANDYFAHSPSAQTREIAAGFGARSIEVRMSRAQQAPPRWRQWLQRLNPRHLLVSLWRRGLAGTASLALALAACYGTLALVALLPVLGVSLMLNETVWAGAIAVFALLTAVAVGAGALRHRRAGPPVVAGVGVGTVLHALFVDYHMLLEAAGFVLLAVGVFWDLHLRRRSEAELLGLKQ